MIPQRTTVTLRPRPDTLARLRSGAADMAPIDVDLGGVLSRTGTWADYVVGVVWALRSGGHDVRGFELDVASQVPVGAGLSSSAALEVATLRALRDAFGLALDDRDIAAIAHDAEVGFVGARVGKMDQLVSSLGRDGEALLMDMRSLEARPIPLPSTFEIALIDSGLRHDHASGGYNERRAECETAARSLGLRSLRDAALGTDVTPLPERLARRARHVISENARVLRAAAALQAADIEQLGSLVDSSHASLRDDFEVSLPAIDRIVAIARAHPAACGARLTGGGFGGSVLAIARPGRARELADATVDAAGAGTSVVLPAA